MADVSWLNASVADSPCAEGWEVVGGCALVSAEVVVMSGVVVVIGGMGAVVVGGAGDDGGTGADGEAEVDMVFDTRLVRRRPLLLRKYGGE